MNDASPLACLHDEAHIALCLEAATALLAPNVETGDGAITIHDPGLARRALQDMAHRATTPRLRAALRRVLDVHDAVLGTRPNQGDLPWVEAFHEKVLREAAAGLGLDPEQVASNVVWLRDRRPVTGMVPEANRGWSPVGGWDGPCDVEPHIGEPC